VRLLSKNHHLYRCLSKAMAAGEYMHHHGEVAQHVLRLVRAPARGIEKERQDLLNREKEKKAKAKVWLPVAARALDQWNCNPQST